mgnify:CR=1 FL=1
MKEVLVITDDKKSSINQCLALINSLKKKKKLRFEHKIINRKLIHEFPNIIIYYFLIFKSFFKKKEIKKTDCIISCGRISAPYSLILKKELKCKNIHILDPYFYKKRFDKIILPSHDNYKNLELKNVIQITGTLVKKEKILKSKIDKFNKLITRKKIITCFVGGDGRSSRFNKSDIINLINGINHIKSNYDFVYCLSRRTTSNIKELILEKKKRNHFLFEYKEINPYWYLIERSSFFIVSQDSVSMISDSISTGKPVFIFKIKFLKEKIKKFLNILFKKGIVKFFDGKISYYKYKPVNESLRVIKMIDNLF